jgi:hypothetical protein
MENEELLNEIKSLRTELDELKDLVYTGIIKPIEDDYNSRKYNEALDIWKERYGEKLKPYEERLKATEGDDFDFMKASYDAWNETEDDSDEWVDAIIKSIDQVLEPLAKVFGVPQEEMNATIEVENGEVKDVVADTEPEEGEEEGATEEEPSEEPGEEEGATEGASDEELSEEEQFQKELDDAYEKYKGQRSY